MLTDIGYVLSGMIGLGIVFIGVRFLVVPRSAAAAYGVPVAQDGRGVAAYLSVKGVRDVASGLFIAVLIVAGNHRVLGAFMFVAALIPLGDMLIVLRNHGPRAAAFGIHGATAVALVAIGTILAI